MFKSIFSKKSHTQIITQIITLIFGFVILLSSPKPTNAATACCPTTAPNAPQYVYDIDIDKCVMSMPGVPPIDTVCSSTEVCRDDVCVDESDADDLTPPEGTYCGYPGQACCAPGYSGSTTCIAGYEPSKEIHSINDLQGCICITESTRDSEKTNSQIIEGLLHDNCDEDSIDTALGCIPIKYDEFVPALLRFLIGIAGAAALILMIVGAIMVMTGGSNPEQVQRGKEIFTGAIIGLLFIIFSVVILQIIAGDIIQLSGFTR